MPLMVLPPGPMSRPILSTGMRTVSIRSALLAQLGARRRRERRSSLRDFTARGFGFRNRFGEDFVTDACKLEIKLEAGDAGVGAAEFEIHVAEIILTADDVEERGVTRKALRR